MTPQEIEQLKAMPGQDADKLKGMFAKCPPPYLKMIAATSLFSFTEHVDINETANVVAEIFAALLMAFTTIHDDPDGLDETLSMFTVLVKTTMDKLAEGNEPVVH